MVHKVPLPQVDSELGRRGTRMLVAVDQHDTDIPKPYWNHSKMWSLAPNQILTIVDLGNVFKHLCLPDPYERFVILLILLTSIRRPRVVFK